MQEPGSEVFEAPEFLPYGSHSPPPLGQRMGLGSQVVQDLLLTAFIC